MLLVQGHPVPLALLFSLSLNPYKGLRMHTRSIVYLVCCLCLPAFTGQSTPLGWDNLLHPGYLALVPGQTGNNTVRFEDKNFEKFIRSQLGKATGSVTARDMRSLTYIHIPYKLHGRICSIAGLEYAVNLQQFRCFYRLTDITPLKNLTKLKVLEVPLDCSDFSPLSGLTSLEKVDIMTVSASGKTLDLGNLAAARNLNTLIALGHRCKNVQALGGMRNLERLLISNTGREDHGVLGRLTNLKQLALRHCGAEDLSSLQSLTRLVSLELDDNQVRSISFIPNLRNLQELNMANLNIRDQKEYQLLGRLTRLQKISLANCNLFDYTFVRSLKNLKSLTIDYKKIDIQRSGPFLVLRSPDGGFHEKIPLQGKLWDSSRRDIPDHITRKGVRYKVYKSFSALLPMAKKHVRQGSTLSVTLKKPVYLASHGKLFHVKGDLDFYDERRVKSLYSLIDPVAFSVAGRQYEFSQWLRVSARGNPLFGYLTKAYRIRRGPNTFSYKPGCGSGKVWLEDGGHFSALAIDGEHQVVVGTYRLHIAPQKDCGTDVYFYPNGSIQKCYLARDHRFGNLTCRAKGEVHFFKDGRFRGGTLKSRTTVNGIDFPAKSILLFYPGGNLMTADFPGIVTIKGVAYTRLKGWVESLRFYKNGQLRYGGLARDAVINGKRYRKGKKLEFLRDGRVKAAL